MNIYIVLFSAIVLSIGFHFAGVYANAKKTVWVMLILFWAAAINIAMSEIKPKGYDEVEKLRGKYPIVDKRIKAAYPEISLYELLSIKKSYEDEKARRETSKP